MHRPCDSPDEFKPLLFLLDRAFDGVIPSIRDVLRLADAAEPSLPTSDLKFVDALSELQDFGIEDSIDLNTLGVTHLATLGCLGMDRARRLHQYNLDKIIVPLRLMETDQTPSVQEMAAPSQAVKKEEKAVAAAQVNVEEAREREEEATHGERTLDDVIQKGKGRLIKEESVEVILDWLEGTTGCEFETIKEEDVEDSEVDELDSTDESDDAATSVAQEF
jgi:hypothetical protein